MFKNCLLTRRRALWLGLATLMGSMTRGRNISLNQQAKAPNDPQMNFTVVGEDPLRKRAASKGLIYGAATKYRFLHSDVGFAAHFVQECAMLVPEVELKWEVLRPSPKDFNFAPGDWMAEFASAHGLLLRGHTLVWGGGLPKWFAGTVNSQNAEQILLKHITSVVGHYAGKMHSWDVVNEAIHISDGRADGLRNKPWLELLGPDYIDIAFRAAAEADPQALLVYNDYGLEYDIKDDEAKRVAVLKLLERLKFKDTPVHALGMQAHLRGDKTSFNLKKLKTFLQDVADLGLKILVTELDVTDNELPQDAFVRDRFVARAYNDYLSIVLDEPAVIAVLTWGLSDRYTWLAHDKPRNDNAPVRILPLDTYMKRKLAWKAIASAFDKAPKR